MRRKILQTSESDKSIHPTAKTMYFLVLAAAVIFYAASCAKGPLWQDSGMIQYRVWHNDIEGGLGLALSHPLFYIIAIGVKYIPVGEFGYRVNLLSAVMGAVTIANIFLLVRLLTGRNFAAIISAVTLAVSHTFWAHSAIVETYTLYTALFSSELLIIWKYLKTGKVSFLYWLGLLNGLAVADHLFGVIPLACYTVFVFILLIKKKIQLKNAGVILGLWIVGALPYEYLIIKNMIQTGNVISVMSSALFGNSWENAVLNTSFTAKILKENILFLGLNFPTPDILLGLVGIWAIFKLPFDKVLRNLFIGLAVLFLIFASRYTVPDRYAFFIPFYVMLAIFAGLGVYFVQSRLQSKALLYFILLFSLMPVPVYAAAPAVVKKTNFNLGTRNNIPYRDDAEYFLKPWRTCDDGPARFANEAFMSAEKDSIIYADGTTVYALFYNQQVKGQRPDVKIVSGHGSSSNIKDYDEKAIDNLIEQKPIYVVCPEKGYCPEFLIEKFDFIKTGVLYKAINKKS